MSREISRSRVRYSKKTIDFFNFQVFHRQFQNSNFTLLTVNSIVLSLILNTQQFFLKGEPSAEGPTSSDEEFVTYEGAPQLSVNSVQFFERPVQFVRLK